VGGGGSCSRCCNSCSCKRGNVSSCGETVPLSGGESPAHGRAVPSVV
jgi:hypothetical protein